MVRTLLSSSLARLWLVALVVAFAEVLSPSFAGAASSRDDFYRYTGVTPLADIAAGTPLKTRNIPYKILGLETRLRAIQILYRSTDPRGRATVNVTTVVQPDCSSCFNRERVISYQSFYDSLNPEDEPSVQIAGAVSLSGLVSQIEVHLFAPFLREGYSVFIPDTQGQTANFAVGPEYGMNTLDAIRAALHSPQVDLSPSAKVVMMGYSGGAIATEWAAELAPTYAPDLKENLIGATFDGALVHPGHNLDYVRGSLVWAGVIPMAIVGIARSYGIDLDPYLTRLGKRIFGRLQTASIINILGQYPGLQWRHLFKPRYPKPEYIPAFVSVVNKLIMGTAGTPQFPLLVGQGFMGEFEGSYGGGKYGMGDGVMIAGDVRSLMRRYCDAGVKVQYNEYAESHIPSARTWVPQAREWTFARFAAADLSAAPQNCSEIVAGNALEPLVGAK